MTDLRRALGPLAALWLLCQLGFVAAAPITVWMGSSADDCTCPIGDHATCPMHHKNASGLKVCAMRSVNDPASVVLSPTYGLIGFTPNSTHTVVLTSSSHESVPGAVLTLSRPAPPDPPPPRA